MCVMLNEAYETLMDGTRRAVYDQELLQWLMDDEAGYTGRPLSKVYVRADMLNTVSNALPFLSTTLRFALFIG
jgi:curved DNA-binding protein CbpA